MPHASGAINDVGLLAVSRVVRTVGSFLLDLASRLGSHRTPRLPTQLDALQMHEGT